MEELAHTHLINRKGTWYYRRRVPQHLISTYEKEFIQQSLKTKSLTEATKRRNVLDVKYDVEFQPAVIGVPSEFVHGGIKVIKAGGLSAQAAKDRIATYMHEHLVKFERRYTHAPAGSNFERAEVLADKGFELQALEDLDHPDQHMRVSGVYQRLFPDEKLIDSSEPEVAEMVRRALVSIVRKEIAFVKGELDHVALTGSNTKGPDAQSASFAQLATQYLSEERNRASANMRRPQWVEKLQSHVAAITEIVGAETPVSSVTYDTSLYLRDAIARFPAHREKRYPGLPLSKAMDRAASDNAPLLSPTSQAGYLGVFRNVLKLALAKGLIVSNPAADLRPLKRDTFSAADKRMPFSQTQIKEFFASEFYKQWNPKAIRPYTKADRDWRFWLPLLMVLTGMRPGEACQMLVGDITKTPSGVWVANVVASDDDETGKTKKKLKTSSSRRSFPIHPSLLKVGFIDFVVERQKAGPAAPLFADLKPSRRGYYSDYPNRRFREHFLRQAVDLDERQTFYSFRHSFRDALRRIKAPDDVISALGGWTEVTKVSDNYGNKFDPDYLFPFVSKIEYVGLELDFRWQPLA